MLSGKCWRAVVKSPGHLSAAGEAPHTR